MSEEQEILIETARDYARSVLLDLDRRCDVDETPITSALPQLAEMGFLNLCLPESVGGLGCSYRAYAAIIHELAYASPSAAVTVAVHNMVGAILAGYVTSAQRQRWLEPWGQADSFSAFAVSEAGAGSDLASTRLEARRNGSGFRLTGEKMWITNGLTCRWLLTLGRIIPSPPGRPHTMFMVDANQTGVKRTPIHGKMGIRASETAVVHYEDAEVPAEGMVGPEGQGMAVALSALDRGRVGIASQATGIAEACLDAMVAYARERQQFGQVIGGFQAIQNMIADSRVELDAARVLIDDAADRIDSGRVDGGASSKAKLYATEAANRIAYRAVQVHGGTGYVHECRVEQLYRDARVTTIYEGTSEIQRLVIARSLIEELSV